MGCPVRSGGLAAQLQALRTTLQRKYVQEVAALKEQHNRELRRLREEKDLDWKREGKGAKVEDLSDIYRPGCSGESNGQGKKRDWERTEEEVAKVRVHFFLFLFFRSICSASIDLPSEIR